MDNGDGLAIVVLHLLFAIRDLDTVLHSQHVDSGTLNEEELTLFRVRRVSRVVHLNARGSRVILAEDDEEDGNVINLLLVKGEAKSHQWAS